MSYQGKSRIFRAAREESGVVAVEFVLLFPLLLLILVGIMEFGHLWYVRQGVTNASREAARAAVIYYTDPTTRETFVQNKVTTVVQNYLTSNRGWPTGTYTWVANASSYTTGQPLLVTVTVPKPLMLLDKLIPAFAIVTVQATTTMIFE